MIKKRREKRRIDKDALPETVLVEIVGDVDGELTARLLEWRGRGKAPVIHVNAGFAVGNPPAVGDQVLVRLKKISSKEYNAAILEVSDDSGGRIIGVFKPSKDGGIIIPTDRKIRKDFFVPRRFVGKVREGDLVAVEKIPSDSGHPRSRNSVKIVARLGKKDDPRLISLIAIHSHSIPDAFSREALKEADGMKEPTLSGGREDLRSIPLVTIDGADARDFDDAVFAEPDVRPANAGGWHILVAIADVSYYVRQGSELDKTAFKRGNSTYFADRVVPMLPEKLSNDLCSLKPNVGRACLACHLWIDRDGKLIDHKFTRGLMRSTARLTYEEVENAHQGYPDAATGSLFETVIKPLYKAYGILKRARSLRGALEIDLPERKVLIDKKGIVTAIVPRHRLESHQLVEEFMILANVAAAEALEGKKAPCIYRIHDKPAVDRLEGTRTFLKEIGYSLPKSESLHPKNINRILTLSADKPDKELVHTLLLRTQSPAIYSSNNIGHFGLALEKYAHFTSPIRRYADLMVHRSLVKSHKLGIGGLKDSEAGELHEISDHISLTERRSMIAERDSMDRFTAQYLSTSIGKEFKGKIGSVTHFGLFVTLEDSGADGLVPIRSLPRDYYVHDEKRHTLTGRKSGHSYRLSQPVIVRLLEADPLCGKITFKIVEARSEKPKGVQRKPSGKKRTGKRQRK